MISEKNKDFTWKDRFVGKLIGSIVFSLSILFFLSIAMVIESTEGLIFCVFMVLIFGLIFIAQIRQREISINSRGMWTGNMTGGEQMKKLFFYSQKNIFLSWPEIKNLAIIRKPTSIRAVQTEANFLIITAKNGQSFECLLVDKEGFINAIKKLNKLRLLEN